MNTSSPRLRILAAALVLWAGAACAQWETGAKLPALAPYGLAGTLPNLAGKVVLVDFWASWCGPCKASFPILDELHKTYGARGFAVLAVNVDEDAAKQAKFLADHPVSFPVVHDAAQKLVAAAGIEAMPSSFLVDRAGTIRFVHVGFKPETTLDELKREIEGLLGPAVGP